MARVLRGLAAAALVACASNTGAEQRFAANGWEQGASSGVSQPAPQRYNPWSGSQLTAPPVPATDVRDPLGQRTWGALAGEGRATRRPSVAAAPAAPASPGVGYGDYGGAGYKGSVYMGGGLYGGFSPSSGPAGRQEDPSLSGLSIYGLGYGYPSLLGIGGLTPWGLPW